MNIQKLPAFRLLFDRKHTAGDIRKAPVQLEIMYHRQRKYIATGLRLYSHQWKDGRVVETPGCYAQNQMLAGILQRAEETTLALFRSGTFSLAALVSSLTKEEGKRDEDLPAAIAAEIKARTDIRESTRKAHRKLPKS
ncbi:MAG: hypothetical protein LUI04_05150, partial [Porphyromonadaceae bacterium]|nr:hypothetical protein [Porphyromonadaceae bacterium]